MEGEFKPKVTPRFGQTSKTDFYTLLKETLKKRKQKKNKSKSKRKNKQKKIQYSELNTQKDIKNSNSHKELDLINQPQIKRELAIERWFCDYPKKKFELRNDFDQDHSKIFLQEKEKAFEKLNFNDDLLLSNTTSKSN